MNRGAAHRDVSWFWIAIGILIVVRVLAVAFYPATGFPDRFGYLAYADVILSGSEWLHTVEGGSPLPGTAFRAAGYPLILAFFKLLFGNSGFATAIQIFQCAATVAACIPLFSAVRRLVGQRAAVLAVLGFGLSVNLAFELSLLPDALSIAAWITIVSIAMSRWLESKPFGPAHAVLLGVLAIYIVMARGNGLHLLILTFPILALAAWQSGRKPTVRAATLILFYLPGLLAYGGVSIWNDYRTGERFFTTGAQIALVQPVFRMADQGAKPFDGDDPLRMAIRDHAADLRYEQIYDVNRALFIDHGMTPKQIADANIQLYLDTVLAFPGAFGRMWLRNFDDKLAIGLINPAFGLHEAHRLVMGERALPGFSAIVKRGEGGWQAIPYAILYGLGMLLSLVLFCAAILWAPVRAAHAALRGSQRRRSLACLALWSICVAVIAYYCALFLVLRYVIMLTPFLIAIGAWSISWPSVRGRVR